MRPTACPTRKSADPSRDNVVAQKREWRTPFVERSFNPGRVKLIGYYSIDGDRKFLPNASRLMYYNPPAEMRVYADLSRGVHMNLNEGIDKAVVRNISFLDEGISILLQWIKLNYRRIKANPETGRWITPKFVCNRGVLDLQLRTSVRWRDSWILYAARWKGTIYLVSDKNKKKAEFADENQKKFGSWGHKFEQFVLSKSPDKLPDTTKPVIEPEEFRCVYQRNIGNHSVMYCSIMKGLVSNKPLKEPLPFNQLKFIEVKTNRIIETPKHEIIFNRFKTLLWWTQSYLTNTQHVLCGFRDDAGVVHKLTVYDLQQIIEMGKPYWKPENCVHYCKSMLTRIEDTVIRDCNVNIYKFERSSDGQITTSELPASSEHAFLPSSFLEASG